MKKPGGFRRTGTNRTPKGRKNEGKPTRVTPVQKNSVDSAIGQES
jgi:hypothetical protein